MQSSAATKQKCLVIGLDGAEPNLIWPWAKEGKLPHIAQLMERGVHGPLQSTFPPISAAAWVTFMTGQQPGRHGVFDFRNYNPLKYAFQDEAIVSSAAIAGYTLMDAVGASGRRVGAVTVPITYPAWEINGAMVSGYPTPDASTSFTFPPELGDQMRGLTEDSALFRASSPARVLDELNRLTRERARVSAGMLTSDDYDLFVLVIGSPDRANHDFWKYQDPAYPAYDARDAEKFGNAILQVYKEADNAVGTLLSAVDEDTTVVVMSDHGGGSRPTKRFNSNAWLRGQGLLTSARRANPIRDILRRTVRTARAHFPYQERLYRQLPTRLKRVATEVNSDAMANTADVIWPQTLAYRFPMHPPLDGIVLNVEGRQREGCLAAGAEYEALRDQIIAAMSEVKDPETGEEVVIAAVRREELYEGDHLRKMPDVVITLNANYEGGPAINGAFISSVPLQELRKLSGQHRMNGIFIMAGGRGIRSGFAIQGARIVDLAPTIMYTLGLPIPRRMDGKVLLDVYDPVHYREHPVEFSDWGGDKLSDWSGFTDEEERIMLEQLRRLGYVD